MTTISYAHHWIIETAAGPASKGRCRLCGEEREFNNSVEWTPQGQTRDKKEDSSGQLLLGQSIDDVGIYLGTIFISVKLKLRLPAAKGILQLSVSGMPSCYEVDFRQDGEASYLNISQSATCLSHSISRCQSSIDGKHPMKTLTLSPTMKTL